MTTLLREDASGLAVRRSSGRRLRTWPRRRILVFTFTGCGLAMLPWLAVLGFGLPGTAVVSHWNLAWTGLDTIEAGGLLATGLLLARGDGRYALTATLTGTALLIDAWFDMLTSASPGALLTATAMAGLIELPLAALCFLLALRGSRSGHPRGSRSGQAGRPPSFGGDEMANQEGRGRR